MFKWREEFSVNITAIDQQHKELFSIGNFIYELLSIKDDIDRYDEIMLALNKLKEYAMYHFETEEKLMLKYGYPDYEEHKHQHESFIARISSLDEDTVDYDQQKVLMDLIIFIANWIEKHILKTDMAYKDFLNEKGVY